MSPLQPHCRKGRFFYDVCHNPQYVIKTYRPLSKYTTDITTKVVMMYLEGQWLQILLQMS